LCMSIALVSYLLHRRASIDLKSKYVVLTGCDNKTGFGYLALQSLLARGAHVIALCLTSDGIKQATAAGAKVAIQCDLTKQESIRAAAKHILETTKVDGLWGVVHNAGLVKGGCTFFQPMSNYREVMEVNFFGVVALNQLIMPAIQQAKGRVVLVSSVDGIVSLPGNAPYDASKFALEAFVDCLRIEASYWGVKVAVVNPATMKTPLALAYFDTVKQTWQKMDASDDTPDAYIDNNKDWKLEWNSEWLKSFTEEGAKNLESIAQDPMITARDILHALEAKHPRHRYLSGTLAKTLFYFLWCMPESVSYAVKKKIMMTHPPSPFQRGVGKKTSPIVENKAAQEVHAPAN